MCKHVHERVCAHGVQRIAYCLTLCLSTCLRQAFFLFVDLVSKLSGLWPPGESLASAPHPTVGTVWYFVHACYPCLTFMSVLEDP